jgi:hypothetical protein
MRGKCTIISPAFNFFFFEVLVVELRASHLLSSALLLEQRLERSDAGEDGWGGWTAGSL